MNTNQAGYRPTLVAVRNQSQGSVSTMLTNAGGLSNDGTMWEECKKDQVFNTELIRLSGLVKMGRAQYLAKVEAGEDPASTELQNSYLIPLRGLISYVIQFEQNLGQFNWFIIGDARTNPDAIASIITEAEGQTGAVSLFGGSGDIKEMEELHSCVYTSKNAQGFVCQVDPGDEDKNPLLAQIEEFGWNLIREDVGGSKKYKLDLVEFWKKKYHCFLSCHINIFCRFFNNRRNCHKKSGLCFQAGYIPCRYLQIINTTFLKFCFV